MYRKAEEKSTLIFIAPFILISFTTVKEPIPLPPGSLPRKGCSSFLVEPRVRTPQLLSQGWMALKGNLWQNVSVGSGLSILKVAACLIPSPLQMVSYKSFLSSKLLKSLRVCLRESYF